MDAAREKMQRDYAWAYFAFHADQRMKTVNFFLVSAGLLSGGITTLLKGGGNIKLVSPLGFLLAILGIVFWRLDFRNRMLVRNGEAALKFLDSLSAHPDQAGTPHVLRIFDRDDYLTKDENSKNGNTKQESVFPLLSGFFGYSKCLNVVFLLFILLGLWFGVWSLYSEAVPVGLGHPGSFNLIISPLVTPGAFLPY